jgi:cephalosporin hydroxylase
MTEILKSLRTIGMSYDTDKFTHHGYDPWYERYFEPLRDKPLTLVEIGINRGGSLRMWREYFPHAKIVGIDNQSELQQYVPAGVDFHLADQSDPEYMAMVINQFAENPQIIIDDASHMWQLTCNTFARLWDVLAPGGIYVIEDLQVCFHPDSLTYSGGWPVSPATLLGQKFQDALLGYTNVQSVAAFLHICFIEKRSA